MLNKNTSQAELMQAAFGPGKDCPSLEELESLNSGATSAPGLADHVASCSYCKTELHLLQTFLTEDTTLETPEMRATVAQLQERSKKILHQPASAQARTPWWKAAFTLPRMAQVSVALATVLVVMGVVIQLRTKISPPPLNSVETNQTGQEVLRSGSFAVINPAGDLLERPSEIRWERTQKSASYRVRLLEVDGNEIWRAETTEDHIGLPSSVRDRILPAKTLFCEISAFDSSGSKIGSTGLVRFRLLQNGNH